MDNKGIYVKKTNHRCVSCGKNSRHNPNLSFFRFPKEQERKGLINKFLLWKANVSSEKLESFSSEYCYQHFRLCSQHFENGMFSSIQKNRLKRDATPTVFDKPVRNLLQVQDESEVEDHPQPSVLLQSPAEIFCFPDPGPSTSSQTFSFSHTEQLHDESVVEDHQQPVLLQSPAEIFCFPDPGPSTSSQTFSFPHTEHLHDAMTQTSGKLSSDSPQKQLLKKQIRGLKRRLLTLTDAPTSSKKPEVNFEEISSFLSDNFSASIVDFMKTQMTLLKKSPKGSRYTTEYKQFALTIYFLSPKVYKFLSKIFRLPSKSTLCRVTQKWDISSGFSDFLFSVLKIKTSLLSEQAKDCILCIDEMSLKTHLYYNLTKDEIVGFHQTVTKKSIEPANHVLVIMARGINSNWKQPLAYFFVNSSCPEEDLKHILFKCISKVKSIGLNVLSVVSDHGGNFHKLTKTLDVTCEKPYFIHEESKVFYMIDVPHLLKSTRNMFFKHSFIINNQMTSKKYLESFYAVDKLQKFRLAPKLTDHHIFPNNFQKMKVKLASQVFSATVAAALNTYVSFGQLPATAVATTDFVEKMDNLFDIFNSSKFTGCKLFNMPFMGTESQKMYLKNMLLFFKNLIVKNTEGQNVTNKMNFIDGWTLTISAFLGLWNVLKAKGVHKVLTRRLNQDCLENFFGKVRQQNGNCRNPTPIQFQRTFKKMFSLNYFDNSEGSNCLDEFDCILGTITPELVQDSSILLPQPEPFMPLKVYTTDYKQLDITEKNAFVYIGGYFMKKCLEKHSCDACKDYAKGQKELTDVTIYAHFRAYQNAQNDTFSNLQMPEYGFVGFLNELENIFCSQFTKKATEKNVGNSIQALLSEIPFQKPCENFPIDYLVSLFVRVRIFYSLKFINRDLRNTKMRKPCSKLMIVNHW